MSSYSRSIEIHRPPADVFAFLSDLRNELRWNPDAVSVEKLTIGDVGAGTRFRAQWRRTRPTEVDVTAFDPPRSWATRSRAMGMTVHTHGHVAPATEGAIYTVTIAAEAVGLARLLVPLAVRMMARGEARNMANIRAALEG